MNTTETLYHEGESFCRPTTGLDVAKFFLFNFGLHAVTVITELGSTFLASIHAHFIAILFPAFGVIRAFDILRRFAIMGGTDLEVAFRSDALCMLVPASYCNPTDATDSGRVQVSPPGAGDCQISGESAEEKSSVMVVPETPYSIGNPHTRRRKLQHTFVPIAPHMTEVHGQYPADRVVSPAVFTRRLNSVANEEGTHQAWQEIGLIRIPRGFKVYRLVGPRRIENCWKLIKHSFKRSLSNSEGISTEVFRRDDGPSLACNFNIVKTIAAIIQILYGSVGLYQAVKDQLARYRFACYQLCYRIHTKELSKK